MSDPIDRLLDSLGAADAAPIPPPPPAFLRAVGRRRLRRRINRTAAGCAVLAAAIGLTVVLRPGSRATQVHDSPLAAARLPDTAALALARSNADCDLEHLRLPDHGGGAPDQSVRLGLRSDLSQFERCIGQ